MLKAFLLPIVVNYNNKNKYKINIEDIEPLSYLGSETICNIRESLLLQIGKLDPKRTEINMNKHSPFYIVLNLLRK